MRVNELQSPRRESGVAGFGPRTSVLGSVVVLSLLIFSQAPAQTCAWCEAGSGAEIRLEGVIDLHAHSAPDSGARSIDAITIAQLARDSGMRALLLKNHYTQTASLAYIVSKAVSGIELYGGIALNSTIGFNPGAVWHMANTTGRHGKVVWMPTFDSEHYHNVLAPNPNHVKISSGGKLLPATLKILDAIKENDLALATGHSSPAESLMLIRAAKQRGIERIIVTHPLPPPVAMSVEQQKKAAAMGALLEYDFGATLARFPMWKLSESDKFALYVKAINEIGPEHIAVSSDLGQPMNPIHTDGLIGYFQRLLAAGFTQDQIDIMSKRNPARLLGITETE